MFEFSTLSEGFLAPKNPDTGVTFILGETSESRISYTDLQTRAKGILFFLQSKGLKPGDELIVLTNNPQQFIDVFWASLLGGIIPVPLAIGISNEHRFKFFRVFNKLARPHVYIDRNNLEKLKGFAQKQSLESELEKVRDHVVIIDEIEDISKDGEIHSPQPEDTAFIQFSSGSTSEPKGVVLSHRNLVSNIEAILAGFELIPQDRCLGWMPLTHDMGLIGFHIAPVLGDFDQVILPTELFIRRPLLWLQKTSEKKASLICSPNFGYKHFLKAFQADKVGDMDLSHVRVLFNGAEPISVKLCEEFLETMAPYGLNPMSMFPVYGLAEATLGASFPKVGQGMQTVRVQRSNLEKHQPVKFADENTGNTLILPIEGEAVQHCQIRITDEDRNPLPENTIGYVEIKGENVTSGYYQEPELSQKLITPDGWLNTGDLGFLTEGQLVISGRDKDIIFSNGQNFFPHDIEHISERVEGVELGKIAVCGVRQKDADQDTVLAFVLFKGKNEKFLPLVHSMKKEVNQHLALVLDHVIPVNKIPKTTSGKIQRYLLGKNFLDGAYSDTISQLNQLDEASGSVLGASSEIETELMAICTVLIPDKDISVDDNIFDIGTTSLTLAQMHQKIEELYPGKLDITDFFEYPTIAQLSAFLQKSK